MMMATVIFSAVAALLVHLAGRHDAARDPRLTGVALALLAVFPMLVLGLPKFAVWTVPAVIANDPVVSRTGVMVWVWAAGFIVAMLRLALAAGCIHRWRNRSTLIERKARMEIRVIRELSGPVAAGVIHQLILVPESWHHWSRQTREIVLEHETAHHDRRDPLWRWIAEIACAVNWYNPLVWWMVRRFSLQCEYACDARVLNKGIAPADYARLLCDLAETRTSCGTALAMAERASLENRVKRLIGARHAAAMAGMSLWIAMAVASASALAMMGAKTVSTEDVPPAEVGMRWSANPFPGEN